jgi:hypothetical protein
MSVITGPMGLKTIRTLPFAERGNPWQRIRPIVVTVRRAYLPLLLELLQRPRLMLARLLVVDHDEIGVLEDAEGRVEQRHGGVQARAPEPVALDVGRFRGRQRDDDVGAADGALGRIDHLRIDAERRRLTGEARRSGTVDVEQPDPVLPHALRLFRGRRARPSGTRGAAVPQAAPGVPPRTAAASRSAWLAPALPCGATPRHSRAVRSLRRRAGRSA